MVRTRQLGEGLRANERAYLYPSAQDTLLASPRDCLAVLEKAMSWEAEKLYGVEGIEPFDDF